MAVNGDAGNTGDAPPDESTCQHNDNNTLTPAVLAGVVRSFAASAATSLALLSKGLLKWMFKYPVKLFRPSAVNPFMVFSAFAKYERQQLSLAFLRQLIQRNGASLTPPPPPTPAVAPNSRAQLPPVSLCQFHRRRGLVHRLQQSPGPPFRWQSNQQYPRIFYSRCRWWGLYLADFT